MWNVIPVSGVLFFGWSAFSLLIFYWIENVVIGAFNALKLSVLSVLSAAHGKTGVLAGAFLVPFFCLHYGLFCYVHGVFLLAMLLFGGMAPPVLAGGFEPSNILPVMWEQVQADEDLRLSVLALIGAQALAFLFLWLLPGKWRDTHPMIQMFEPYGRIIVMHLTLFVAIIPVMLIGEFSLAVLALALMKCGLELGLPQFTLGVDKLKEKWPPELSDK
jgi:hypothetical protein